MRFLEYVYGVVTFYSQYKSFYYGELNHSKVEILRKYIDAEILVYNLYAV